jgi:hypothetical protein
MIVTRTIEGVDKKLRRKLKQMQDVITTRHIIRCDKCGAHDEYNEGDSFEAASWFEMNGWRVRAGVVKCPDC